MKERFMKMKGKKLTSGAIALLMCAGAMVNVNAKDVLKGSQKAYIVGDDWGPAIAATIVKFDHLITATSISKKDFSVVQNNKTRNVLDAYASTRTGKKVKKNSQYVTIKMKISPIEGSPFHWDDKNWINSWEKIIMDVNLNKGQSLVSKGKTYTTIDVKSQVNVAGKDKIVPALSKWNTKKTYKASDGVTYSYGEFVPQKDKKKNALVIWLHGMGEGGNDPTIDLLGNKVTALGNKTFQKAFKGAYVLAPQCPTYWMDTTGKRGAMTTGDKESYYAKGLFDLITHYVKTHKDIDSKRIIIGGCSNGGYMTMNMILKHPKYFAAAYPICEAYATKNITTKELKSIKNLPIWITYAKTDTTVDPKSNSASLFTALKKIKATNVHVSAYKDIHDISNRFKALANDPMVLNDQGTQPLEYQGHWSWLYFFNNKNVDGKINCFKWLASQRR